MSKKAALLLLHLVFAGMLRAQEPFSLLPEKDFPNTGSSVFCASPDGSYLAAATIASIQLWNRSADGYVLGELISGFSDENATISCMTIAPNGSVLIAATKDAKIHVFVRSGFTLKKTQSVKLEYIPEFLSVSADGNFLAVNSADSKCSIWRVSGGGISLAGTPSNVSQLLFSPGDAGQAYGGGKMYRFTSGVLSPGKPLPNGESFFPDEFNFSPDGNYFAAIYYNDDDNLYLWKKQADGTFKQTSRVEHQKWGSRLLEFSPENHYIAVYNHRTPDKKQRHVIFRIDGGALSAEGEFGNYSEDIQSFQFISDGKFAFAASVKNVYMYRLKGVSGNKRFNKNSPLVPSPDNNVVIKNEVVVYKPDTTQAKTPDVLNITNIFWVNPDPEALDGKPIVSENNTIEIQVKVVSGKKTKKDDIKIIINGKEMEKTKSGTADLKESMQDNLYEYTYINSIPLEQTADNINTIDILANGKKCGKTLKVLYSSAKPNLHILSIGTSLDLEFPKKDAGDFAELFRNQGGGSDKLFGSVEVRTLIGKDATTNAIKEAIERYRYDFSTGAIGPKDVLLIFISSHGFIYQDQLRIQGDDFKDMYKETYSVAYNEIVSRLKEVGCKKLIFLDACFSGGAKASISDVNNAIQDLNKQSTGVTTFSSSSNDEFSYEDTKWQNGAFTFAIKEALKDGKADADKNGIVTIGELYLYVSKRVPDIVTEVKGKSQHPSMPVTDLLSNTAIFITGK